MMLQRILPSVSCLSFLLAALGTAQGPVWVVDFSGSPADFTNLQTAIDTVADGDVLLIKDGTYAPITIDGKSLTLQAEGGALVTIRQLLDTTLIGGTIRNLGPSQSVRLRGLTILGSGEGLVLESNLGAVWIEECTLTCQAWRRTGAFGGCDGSGAGVLAQDCADIVLIRSTLTGVDGQSCVLIGSGPCYYSGKASAGHGLLVDSANVHAFGCTFTGGKGRGTWGSRLYTCGGQSNFECGPQKGGDGISGSGAPHPFLFLSDCTVSGGDGDRCAYDEQGCYQNAGGDGLLWAGTAAVVATSFQAGVVTGTCAAEGCCPGPDGVPVVPDPNLDLEQLPGRPLRMRIVSPVRENGTIQVDFEGVPSAPIWLLSSLDSSPVFVPKSRGTLLVGSNPVFRFIGFTDATGVLHWTAPLGPLPAGVAGRVIYSQAFMGTLPLGKLRRLPPLSVLGEGSMLLELDESF